MPTEQSKTADTPVFLTHYWYNKCTGCLVVKLKTLHFNQFWRPQMYRSQGNNQLSFEGFNQPIERFIWLKGTSH